jgi:AmmeMemoRadiSam system protein A/AmmeMemoRadiSam system protein B
MAIIAAFMVPHPPIIVPEVGNGSEKEIAATTQAYAEVASKIAELKPDTIIISSPHADAYADYFQIADGDVGIGSFTQFGAPNVTFRVFYDRELVKRISLLAASESFPAGTEGEQERYLDHGTMVPLYFIQQEVRDFKIVRLGLSGLSLLDHYHLGQIIKKAVEDLGRRAVFVASGDLSHCQKADGPYGFKPAGPKYDEQIMKIMGSADFGSLFTFDQGLLNQAEECGHRSFVILAGALDRTAVEALPLSHEATFGVGYGICQYIVKGPDPSRAFSELYLSREALLAKATAEKSDPYVRLARAAIKSYITSKRQIGVEPTLPAVMRTAKAGVFVSIHKFGELRGCIGTIAPEKDSIAEEIIANGIAASTEDPRFDPIQVSEFPFLDISVDVLTPPIPIISPADLNPKIYGVIVESGNKRGVLLPNLEGVDTIKDQLDIAKRKAGIEGDEDLQLYRFEVVRHL